MSKKIDVEYVYAGALMHKEQVVHSYIQVKGGELIDTGAIVFMQPLSKHKVGSVLKFTAIDQEDNLLPGSAHFERMWEDGPQTMEWASMSQAILTSEKAYGDAVTKSKHELDLLEPLRSAYGKLGERERAVLLARISAYIVGEE